MKMVAFLNTELGMSLWKAKTSRRWSKLPEGSKATKSATLIQKSSSQLCRTGSKGSQGKNGAMHESVFFGRDNGVLSGAIIPTLELHDIARRRLHRGGYTPSDPVCCRPARIAGKVRVSRRRGGVGMPE